MPLFYLECNSRAELADYGVCPLYKSIATRLRALAASATTRPPIAVGVGRCIFCGTLMRQLTLPHSIGRIPTAITDRILSVITSQARSADMIFLGRRRGKNDTRVNRVPDAFAHNVKCLRRR